MSQSTAAPTAPAVGAPPTPSRSLLLLLMAISCLSTLGSVLIAPVLPQMAQAFADVPGVATLVPVALTIPALFIALLAPFAGVIADKLDRKRLLLVALGLYAVAGTAPMYLPTLQSIIISRVVVGICEAAIMTCATTLIGDYWSGRQRSKYLSLQALVTALAAIVFLGIGGVLGAQGWRTPFLVYGVAVFLVPLVVVLIGQPRRRTGDGGGGRPMPWAQLAAPCLVTLVGGVVFFALIVQLSFVLTDAGLTDPAAIGGLSALMAVATAAGCLVFTRLTHRTPRALLPVAFGLMAVGFAVVAATSAVPVIAAGAVLSGLGSGLLLPTLLTWAVNRLDFDQRGRGTGSWTGSVYLGQFASPLIIGGIGAAAGGLRGALAVLAGVAVVMAVVSAAATRGSVPLDVTAD